MRWCLLIAAGLTIAAAVPPADAQFYGWGGYRVFAPYPYPYAAYPYPYPPPYPAPPVYSAPPVYAPPVYAPPPYWRPRVVYVPVPRLRSVRPVHRARVITHRRGFRPLPRLQNPLLGPLSAR